MNQNYYDPNLCYNSISSDFYQYQPPQYSVTHQPLHIKSMADLLLEEKLSQALQALCEKLNKNVQEKQEENNVAKEQAAKVSSQYSKPPSYYDDDDDDDDKESSIPLKVIISELPLSIAITPDFLITNSLIMEDEHLDTIPETKSFEENESSVKDLNLTPSESKDWSKGLSEDLSDIESECDMPFCDDFTSFSNPLFYSNDDFTSSDEESLSNEDVPEENFKIYSNPLFDEEIISTKIDPRHFNTESDLIESLLNRDTSIVSSPKFDSLLEEFSGELAHIDLISLEIDEADFDPEEEIRLVEKLFDSLMEEIDIFFAPGDSIPPSIENDDYDSEGDILFLEKESFHFDRYYDPSSPRPPAKPPDDDGIHFDVEPDTGILTAKVVDDISEHYVLMPSIFPTHPTRCPVIDTLLPFSSKNKDKVFNPILLASNEEKSPYLLSYWGFKVF
ncbi:hypothetical protein Tco_0739838 [Tanacetum coccineum]